MYNSKAPNIDELPSSNQLLRSTLIATIIACLISITIVLPAEYGVDPTGIGSVFGLTEMGQVKVALQREAEAEQLLLDQLAAAEPAPVSMPAEAAVEVEIEESGSDENFAAVLELEPEMEPEIEPEQDLEPSSLQIRAFQIDPDAAVEIKLEMSQGALASYKWISEGGAVNFDVHADNPSISYFNYSKGLGVTSDEGTIEAEFDGFHGWFWRNRGENTLTVTIEFEGDYQSVKEY